MLCRNKEERSIARTTQPNWDFKSVDITQCYESGSGSFATATNAHKKKKHQELIGFKQMVASNSYPLVLCAATIYSGKTNERYGEMFDL